MNPRKPPRPASSRATGSGVVWQLSVSEEGEGVVVVGVEQPNGRPARPFGTPELKSNPGDDVVTEGRARPKKGDLETDEGEAVIETEDDGEPL